jgi:N-acetylmuramoyl-L-alanine amidase
LRRQVLVTASRLMLVLAGVLLLTSALIGAHLLTAGGGKPPAETGSLFSPSPPSDSSLPASPDPSPTAVPAPTTTVPDTPDTPNGLHIGIVAGHAGYDPGAVCPDGLTEAEVNMVIAREVVAQLIHSGYQVDLLEEFDDRLPGYRADALVSIHADSCEVPGASGFKVARITDSAIPEAEDRLVDCLYREYEATTGLPRHPNSITDNMTNYHAFREIDFYTPGAIIETGFLLDDRNLLVHRPELVAEGIAAGLMCFLEDDR